MELFAGVDIGTSGTKTACFDVHGNVVSSSRMEYDFCNLSDGRRELDAELIFSCVKDCLRKIGRIGGIRSITVSSLGEAIIPIDRYGNPLCNAIIGTDFRGEEQAARFVKRVGEETIRRITGLNTSTIYSVNKILWLKENDQALYSRIKHIFTFQDFIIWKLSGAAAIDYSMASRTMLFDINEMNWSEKILQAAGISRTLLSNPVRSGTNVGKMKKELANDLGLSENTAIIAGTHDHICNALGCGVYRAGWCSNTVGTTEGLTAVIGSREAFLPNINKFQMSCEPFAFKDLFNTVAWNNTSGALLRWFINEFCRDYSSAKSPYNAVEANMPAGPTGLLVLPHFSGAATPHMDSLSQGAVVGLTLGTSRAQLYKALVEGANYELAVIINCLTEAGLPVDHIISSGNALSEKLLQIKADILGIPIETVTCKLTGPLGGAILGAVSCEVYETIQEAVEKMVHYGKQYVPNEKCHRRYLDLQNIYSELYSALKGINHQLSACRICSPLDMV